MDLTGKGVGMDFGIFIKTKSGEYWLDGSRPKFKISMEDGSDFERGKVYIEQFPTLYRLGTAFDYNKFIHS